jgi:hypothetical protein
MKYGYICVRKVGSTISRVEGGLFSKNSMGDIYTVHRQKSYETNF